LLAVPLKLPVKDPVNDPVLYEPLNAKKLLLNKEILALFVVILVLNEDESVL
jgi:hypothetical protein